MRRYTHAPHPFVLCPPVDHPAVADSGMRVDLLLVVLGQAIEYLPFILLGLLRLGEMGLGVERLPFEVESVRSTQDQHFIYTGQRGTPVTPPTARVLQASVGSADMKEFDLHFVTPLRIRIQDRVRRRPEFAPLVSAALRRLELLCRVHQAGEYSVDGAAMAELAKSARLVSDRTRWHDLSRYSQRQDHRMPLGGIVGSATFDGDYGTFQDLMALAGRVHVGKGTAFGHGRFRMECHNHGTETP